MTHSWFTSSVPHHYGAMLELDATDVLVIPECVIESHDPAPGCRKVIYNQNYFLTFASVRWQDFPRWDPIPPVWTSSDASVTVLNRLRGVVPIDTVDYIPLGIDTELLRPLPRARRQRKVVWMPRKRHEETELLHALFAADRRFDNVTLRPLDGLTTKQIARELGNASIFVALGRDEGFGLPVAEALASGCLVVDYPAGGGTELFDAPGAYPVPDPDTLAIIDQVASLLANESTEAERASYREWIKQRYNESRQREHLLHAVEIARAVPAQNGVASYPLKMLSDPSLHDLKRELEAELAHH